MTRDELDAIRERLAIAKAWRPFSGSWDDIAFGQRAAQDVEALLAEVDRLRDRADQAFWRGVAAMRQAAANEIAFRIESISEEWTDAIGDLPNPKDTEP